MKTMRIVILDEDTDTPAAIRGGGLPGIDLRALAGLSGADVADLLREHSVPAPFVDTSTDTLSGPDTDFGNADALELELRSALQSHNGQPMALLLGSSDSDADPAPARPPGELPFERLNASLVRALRRHELEAALLESEARLRRLGLIDRVTGLPGRELFLDRIGQCCASVLRGGNAFAALMVGFDWPQGGAASWTDTLSPASADILIATLARRLRQVGRRSDSYTRIGGHSFAALLLGNNSVGGSMAMAQKIAQHLGRAVMIDGQTVQPHVSVGVALCPQHGTDPHSMLLHAQAAMEQAQYTHNPVCVYDSRIHRASSLTQARSSVFGLAPGDDPLAPLLADAIEQHQVSLAFQPVVDLRLGAQGQVDWRLRRMETMARWHTPAQGHVPPSVFIPLAEHHALIAPLTDQLLDLALSSATPWREQGLVPALSVNISARLLEDPDLPERVQAALARHQWPAQALVLEVAASALAQPSSQAHDVLLRLGRGGVRLVLDDFGSGLGAYLALADLGTLAELKVDLRSLRQNAGSPRSERGAAVLRSLVTLAQGLGAEVVAKGVEDAGTAAWLQQLGCHAAQGHAWSRPMPAEQVRAWCMAQAMMTREPRH